MPAEADWPSLRLACRTGDPPPAADWVKGRRAGLQLRTGGRIELDWVARRAVITRPRRLEPHELVHPYLAPVAGVVSYWLGREGFHAGAISRRGGVWGVLGDREAGKSSLLAMLALEGQPIFSDDALVLEDFGAFAGPRTIDLRADAARELGVGVGLGVVGARERWRLELPPVPSRLPLRGFVRLRWADSVGVAPVAAEDRLRELGRHRVVRLPPTAPGRLLGLAALPMLTLSRPRDWRAGSRAVRSLLAALDAAAAQDGLRQAA